MTHWIQQWLSSRRVRSAPSDPLAPYAQLSVQRLEDRRVLSATVTNVGNDVTVDITGIDDVIISFDDTTDMLTIDSLDDGTDTTFLFDPTMQSLIINGDNLDVQTVTLTGMDSISLVSLTITDGIDDLDVETTVAATQTITVDVANNITIEATGQLTTDTGTISLEAGMDITLAAGSQIDSGMEVQLTSLNGDLQTDIITAVDDIHLSAANGSVTTNGPLDAGALVDIDALSVTINNTIDADGMVTIDATDGAITVSADITAGNDIELTSTGVTSQITLDAGVGVAATGNDISLTANSLDLSDTAQVDAGSGRVTLVTADSSTLIDLGGADASGTLGLTNDELNTITAGTLVIGDANSGTITISDAISLSTVDTLELITAADIVDGNTSGADITVASLALVAGTGIGSSDALELAVSNLAFRNTTSGDVQIENTGALTITTIGSVSGMLGAELGNFGSGTTSLTAQSPVTIAADLTSVGSLTITAGEISDDPTLADDLTINAGVTVSVTGVGADLTLQAGDDILIDGNATSNQHLIVTAGFNDADSSGAIAISGTLTAAEVTTLSSLTGITDAAGALITTSELEILGSGDVILDEEHNADVVAANVNGALTYLDADGFEVGTAGSTTGITLTASAAELHLTTTAGAIELNSSVSTDGHQFYHSAVELLTDVSLSAGSGNIDFDSTVDGGFQLNISSGVDVTFDDAVGSTDELGAIDINVSGKVTVNDDVQLAAVGSLLGTFTVFANEFELAGSIDTQDGDPFGGGIFIVASTIRLGGSITTDEGNVDLVGPVVLFDTVTINTDEGSVAFLDTIDGDAGGESLTVISAAGGVELTSGAVGGNVAVGDFTLQSNAPAGTIVISNDITSVGNVTLSAESVLVSGAIDTTNATVGNVTITSTFLTALTGDITTTNGNIELNGFTRLDNSITLMTATGNITITGFLDSNDLGGAPVDGLTIIATTGDVFIEADLGSGTTPGSDADGLAFLNVTAGGDLYASGTWVIDSTVTFTTAVYLLDDLTLTVNGDVTFEQTVDADLLATTSSLEVNAVDVDFQDVVGGQTALTSLTVDASGDLTAADDVTVVNALMWTTAGTTGIIAAGAITSQMGAITLVANGTGAIDVAGNITAASDFAATTATGDMTFNGAVEATNGSVTYTNAGQLTLHGTTTAGTTVTQNGAGDVDLCADIVAGDAVSFASDVILTVDVMITSTSGGVIFAGTVDADSTNGMNAEGLTIDAGDGTVDFQAAVGGTTPLEFLIVTTTGHIDADATLETTGTIDLTGDQITLDAAVIAGAQLLVAGTSGITALSDLTAGQELQLSTSGSGAAISVTGAVESQGSSVDIQADGDVDITGTVVAATSVLIDSATGHIDLDDSVTASGGTLQLLAETEVTVAGLVDATGDITIDSNTAAVDLDDSVTSANGFVHITSATDVSVDGAVDGPAEVVIAATAGTVTIIGQVTATAGLVDIMAGTDISIGDNGGVSIDAQDEVTLTTTSGSITTTGSILSQNSTIDLDAGTNLTVGGELQAELAITVTANSGGIQVTGNVTSNTESILLESLAGTGLIEITGNIDAGTSVTIKSAADSVDLDGTVTARDGGIEMDAATDITVVGAIDATETVDLQTTNGLIDLDSNVTSQTGNVEVRAGSTLTVDGNILAAQTVILASTAQAAAVVLHGAVIATNGDVDIEGLTVDADEAISAGGSVLIDATNGTTLAANATVNAVTAITITGDLTTAADLLADNGSITVNGNITLTGDVTFDSDLDDANNDATSDITVTGTIDIDTFTLTLDAGTGSDIDLQGTVSGTGDLLVEEGDEQTYAAISVNDFIIDDATTSVLLTGPVTATANMADLGDITICSRGSIEIQDTLTADGLVDLKADDEIKLDANLSVNDITFQSAVLLCQDVTIAATGDVLFESTIDSAATMQYSLTVNASGLTDFQGEVGGGTNQELGTLTTDAAGTTQIGADVTTAFDQFYNDAVTLTASVTLTGTDNNATDEAIEFGDMLTGGGFDLTISGGGAFAAAVTGLDVFLADRIDTEATFAATSVTVTGTSDLGADVTTTAFQDYQDDVTLTADVVLESSGDDDITFGATVDGVFALTVNTGGVTTFSGDVGSNAVLTSLVTDAAGSTVIDTANIAANVVDFGDAVTLGQTTTISGTTSVTFQSTVMGNAGTESLTVNSDGTVDFDDEISNLTNVTVNADGVTTFSGDVDIAGTLSTDANGSTTIDTANIAANVVDFGDAVTLDQTATITGTLSVTFQSTVMGNAGTENLTVNSDGTVDFDDEISNLNDVTVNADGVTTFSGDIDIAGTLSTDVNGMTKIDTASIEAGIVQFADAVELCQDLTITAGAITFGSTLDEAASSAGSDLTLTITNPNLATGDITFSDAVGSNLALDSLTITTANDVTFSSTVELVGDLSQQAGTGTTAFHGTGTMGIGGQLLVTTDTVTFSTADVVTVGAVVITAQNAISFNANAGLNAGAATITLRANQDNTGSEGLTQADGTIIQTTDNSAMSITIDVDGTGSAIISDLRADTTTGVVTITAGGAITDHTAGEAANITAAATALTAGTGIGGSGVNDLDTAVDNLEAVTTTGGITIEDVDSLTIGNVTGILGGVDVTTSGAIRVTANGSLTVAEQVSGFDAITLSAVGSNSDLTIQMNSGVTTDNGAITLSADRTVTISEDVSTGGSGTITVTGNSTAGARNVVVDSGAVVSVVNGALLLDADQGSQQTGNFVGISVNGATLQSTGTGNITLTGRGGDDNGGSQFGIAVTNGGLVTTSGTGDISLTGLGGTNTGGLNHGVVIDNASVTATGTSAVDPGDIAITGTAGSGASSHAILLSNNGVITAVNANFAAGACVTLMSLAGDVVEETGFVITADNLQLLGVGAFTLDQNNDVDVLAADVDGALTFVDTDDLIVGTVKTTVGITTTGDDVEITAAGDLTVDDDIDTSPGAGGVISVTGGTLNAQLIAGAGDITLNGGNPDLIINVAQTSATTITYSATRDVIINATVTTTGTGADVIVTADSDQNGVGGVQVTQNGQINSADAITLIGSDLFATSMSNDSIRIDADGTNDQLLAVGDITLLSGAAAPMGADIVINGRLHSTTGDIEIDALDTIQVQSRITADAGAVLFSDAVVLTGDLTVVAGTDVEFAATVNDDADAMTLSNLTVTAAGITTFTGAVGNTSAIDSLTANGGGTTELCGGSVTTVNGQTYTDAVVLCANTTLTSNNSGNIVFASTVDGDGVSDRSLAVNTSGLTDFQGAVGNTQALASLTTNATGTTQIGGGSIRTVGAQTYNDAVLLTNDAILTSTTSGNITFQTTLNGARHLTINTAGVTQFNGIVGGSTALLSLNTDAAGSSVINTSAITAGVINFDDAVTINTTTTVTGTTSVDFADTIAGNTGAESLTVVSGGAAAFHDTVTNLTNFTINANGQTTFEGNINISGVLTTNAAGLTRIDTASITAGTVTFNDAVELGQDLTITAGTITFASTLNEAAVQTGSDLTLTITNPNLTTGDITFTGAVGGTTALDSITITNANDVTFSSTVRLTGDLLQQDGTGTTTFNGTSGTGIGGQLNVSTNAITFNTADVVTIGAVLLTADNGIAFNANAGLNAGASTITILANQDGMGSQGFTQASSAIIRTLNETAAAVHIEVGGTGDASISDIRAGTATGVVSITAGGAIVDNLTGEAANITARSAALRAASGIGSSDDIDTDVDQLAFSCTAGLVNISNLGNLTLTAVDGLTTSLAFTGGSLFASGSLTIAMTSQVGGTFNFIAGDDTAISNDLTISANITHLTGVGEITFQAGDDIIQTAGTITVTDGNAATLSRVNMIADHEGVAGPDGDRGGITQTGGNILAGELQVRSFNAVDLSQATNDVDILAAVVTNNGQAFTYRDADDLTISQASGMGGVVGLTTNNGNVTIITGGLLTLGVAGEDIAAGNGTVVINTQGGFTEATGSIITASSLLFLGTGTFTADQSNDVNTLAADIDGTLTFRDVDDLVIGTVTNTVAATTTSGITTLNDDVKLTIVNGNLTIGDNVDTAGLDDISLGSGDLTLNVTGAVTQTTGNALFANGLLLFGTGTVTLNEVTNNVDTLAASYNGTIAYTDSNALVIGTVTDNPTGMAASGISTSNDDVKLTVLAGGLTIGDNVGIAGLDDINVGTGDLTLDVVGNVTQLANNVITANGLQLLGSGTVTLNEAANNVGTIAANYNGTIAYTDANALIIGTVTDEASMMTTHGITTSNDDVKLTVLTGGVTIGDAVGTVGLDDVSLGTGDLTLDVVGNVTQLADNVITASGLQLLGTGTVTLNETANNVGTLAANYNGTIAYTDANALIVGTVTDEASSMTTHGITTSNDDVKLTVLTGGLTIGDAVGLAGLDDIALGTGDLTLNTVGAVTQLANSDITANGLQLLGSGSITLNNSGNNVGTLAASYNGTIAYTDANALLIGTVTDEASSMTTSGIATTNDDVKLTVLAGGLTIGDAVGTPGTDDINLINGDLTLNVVGTMTQTANNNISAGGLQLLGAGTITLTNAANDVDTLAANYDGALSYVDANALVIDTVTDGPSGMTTTGITTVGDDVSITAAGNLTVDADINTSPGTGGVITVTGGTLNAALIAGAGDITLTGGNPDLIINVDQTTATTLTYQATRDVIINATVTTTGSGSDVIITADLDSNGVGGVQVTATGQVVSADAITISGSDLFATAGSSDSIRIDADGMNDQLLAAGHILLQHNAAAPTTADIVIDGRIHSTGGDVTINARDTIRANSVIQADAATGDITFQDAVVLTGDLQVTAGGNVIFQTTIDDDASGVATSNLTVTAAGVTQFLGHVGTTSAIDSLTSNGGGTTELCANITTVNDQTYTDAVVLTTDVILTSQAAGTITFVSTVDSDAVSPRALTINTSGVTDFQGAVGQTRALRTLTTDATGTTQIGGGLVRTTSTQTYGDDVVLTNHATLETTAASANGADLLIVGTVDTQGFDLTIAAGSQGDITLQSALSGGGTFTVLTGDVQQFAAITVDELDIQSATTSVTFHGAVLVTNNVTVNSSGSITQESTLDAGVDVTYTAGTTIEIQGDLTAGNDVTLDSGTSTSITAAVTATAGTIDINAGSSITATDSLLADVDVLLNAGTFIDLTGPVTATLNDVIAVAGTTFNATQPITAGRDVLVTADDEITISGTVDAGNDVVITSNMASIDLSGEVTAGNDVTLTSETSTIITAAVTATAGTIDIDAGTSISATDALLADVDVLLNAGTLIDLTGPVTATTSDVIAVAGTTFNATQPILAGRDVLVTADDEITISGTVDTGNDVTITSNMASIDLSGAVTAGNDVTLSSETSTSITAAVTATAGTIDIDAGTTISSTGALTAGDAITLTAVDGTTLSATADLLAGAGGITITGSLLTAADMRTNDGAILLTGPVVLTGNVVWDSDRFETGGAAITVQGTIATADFNLTVDAGSTGDLTLESSLTGGGNVVIEDGRVILFEDVVTVDNLTIQDATTSVTFADTLTIAQNLSVTSGGTITQQATATVGNDVVYTAHGQIRVQDDLTAVSDITLTSNVGAVTITAPVTANNGNLVVSAGTNVTSNSPLVAGTDISITAGQSITLTSTVNAGDDVQIDAGTAFSATQSLAAGDQLSISAGTTLTLAETADITTGAGGVLLTAPQIITAAEITTTSGAVAITGAVQLTGDVTINTGAAGDVLVTGTIDGTLAVMQSLVITTNAGDITITGDVGTTTALNGIIITTADDVLFGAAITADRLLQQSGTGITTIVGAVNTLGDDGIQLTTTSIQFAAGTASMDSNGHIIILTADAITLPTTFTNADGSTVTLQTLTAGTSIGLEDGTQDLNFTDMQLDTIHAANLVIGSATQTAGISIGSDGAVSVDENLTLLTANSISVAGPLSATTSNTILLDAGNDVSITGSISVLTGDLTVLADDDITFGAAGLVQSQAGNVVITADADGDMDGSGGAITMANGAVVNSGLGTLTISADENITLGQIATDNATADAIVLTSHSGGIIDGGDADLDIVVTNATGVVTIHAVTGVGSAPGAGADAALETQINQLTISNSTSGNIGIDEVNAITILGVEQNGPGMVTLTAGGTMTIAAGGPGVQTQGGNISLITTGTSSDLVLNAAVTSRGGDVTITVGDDFTQAVTAPLTSAGGDVTMTVAGNAMQAGLLATGGGNWSADVTGNLTQTTSAPITTAGGNIDLTVGGSVSLAASVMTSGGNVTLDVTGNTTIAVTAPISTSGGNITAMIAGDTNLASTITTATGNVAFTIGGNLNMAATANVLTANGNFAATVADAVVMQNGAVINTATGTILVSAGSDITLGQLITTNSTAMAVMLQSATGGLIDGGDTGGADIIANATGAMVTMTTATGVGSATGNGADAAIETQIDRLELVNTTSGMVQIDEVDALRILELTQAATGSVTVNTVGNLLVMGGQPGISATSGTVTLNATAATATITVDSRIQTTSGDIVINAADDVRLGAAASIVSTSGDVTMTADADSSLGNMGGEIFLTDGSVINAGSGNITLRADQNITLSQLRTTSTVSLTSTSAGIVDGGDTGGADIIANTVVMQSVRGIGSGNALETTVSLLAANNTTAGAIQIDNNTSLLTIGQVGSVTGITNTGSAAAEITVTNNGSITVNGMVRNATGGDINLTATPGTANLTVNAVMESTRGDGHINLTAGNDLIINDTGSGVDISVVNDGEILGIAGGDVSIGSNVVIESQTGVVTNTEPVLFDVTTPQISALGIGTIVMTVQRPLEVGTVIIIDWGDGTVETFVVTEEGQTTLTFTHQYLGPPNPANPAADIPLNVTVINPSFTTGTMPSPTAGTNQVTTLPYVPNIRFYANGDSPATDPVGDLNESSFDGVFKTPGDGLATFAFDLTPPVELLEFPQPTAQDASLLNVSQPPEQVLTIEELGGQVDQKLVDERVVILEVISPNGELRETVLLPEDVLDNLDGVISNLPDGRYRFLLREPGETQTRLLQDVEVHEGKIADDLESLQNRPRSLRNQMPAKPMVPGELPDDLSAPADALTPDNAVSEVESADELPLTSWRGQRAWRQAVRQFGPTEESGIEWAAKQEAVEESTAVDPIWVGAAVPMVLAQAGTLRFGRAARLFRKYGSQE